jgi:hypothetical protein
MQPFSDLTTRIQHLAEVLEMSIRGITMLRAMPQMVMAVAKAKGRTEHEDTSRELANAERHAEFAEQEVKNGFPVLHANTALGVWSHLEAGIRLLLARWLEHERSAFELDAIQKLKVKLGDYERLQGEDRFFYIIDRMEQEAAAPLKSGINRFEAVLEPFRLSGNVDPAVQRDLFELSQVRNCLLHRAGCADRRLVEACPWLGLAVGEQVKVTHDATERYISSAMHYATELVCRIGERFGVDMAECRDDLRSGRS